MIQELYTKYYPELIRWCHRITGNMPVAEDLVHEAFLRAMLHSEQLKSLNEAQKRAWLFRTTKNLYVDRVRHMSHETIVEKQLEIQTEPAEISELEWLDLIALLPDMEGLLFVMRYLEGYNSRQIGELFSLSPGTVRSKLSSARKHLRAMIGGNQNE